MTAIIQAGFGLLGTLLVIGLIVGFACKKHKALGLLAAVGLLVMMFSCTKTTLDVKPKTLKYKFFRIIEVDLDGHATYGPILHG